MTYELGGGAVDVAALPWVWPLAGPFGAVLLAAMLLLSLH